MPWQIVTLIAPSDEINVNGKVINIHNIDIIKINENGGLNFIEKGKPGVSGPEGLGGHGLGPLGHE
jgi:hypothetical protein